MSGARCTQARNSLAALDPFLPNLFRISLNYMTTENITLDHKKNIGNGPKEPRVRVVGELNHGFEDFANTSFALVKFSTSVLGYHHPFAGFPSVKERYHPIR